MRFELLCKIRGWPSQKVLLLSKEVSLLKYCFFVYVHFLFLLNVLTIAWFSFDPKLLGTLVDMIAH
uniref:Uncharacterized protein n=1 Tax=Nelumbo nucifera TaxID=4432 RepID=A0A822XLY3_NELNU|nr:TPA_asm: hypothetical protein HUJ06_021419 [Nelumbo nucifera]